MKTSTVRVLVAIVASMVVLIGTVPVVTMESSTNVARGGVATATAVPVEARADAAPLHWPRTHVPVNMAGGVPAWFAPGRVLNAFPEASAAAATAETPIAACVVQDQTGSSEGTGVPQLRSVDLLPLVEAIRERGGELALAIVREASNVPLLRLLVPEPPGAPAVRTSNLIARARAGSSERLHYRAQQNAWLEDVDRHVPEFINDASRRLTATLDRRGTDLWSAIRRCDAFLGETGRAGQRRFLVAVTDGLDTAGVSPRPLQSAADVYLVPGTTVGSMGILSPTLFESPAAAFRAIAGSGRTK